MEFKAEVVGLERWVARLKGADKIVMEELRTAGKRAGLQVELKAKGYAPKWRGDLRRSITTKTTTQGIFSTTVVGTNKPYGAATEFGRPSGAPMPPPGALLPWMASKGIPATEQSITGTRRTRDADGNITGSIISGKGFIGPRRGYLPIEYLIARAIKRSAPKPRPFLTKAFKELQPKIRQEFQDVPKRVIARLRGAG